MPGIYNENKKFKIYVGGKKIKKVYAGTKLVYSIGNTVTYIENGITHTEDYDEGESVLSPTSFTPSKNGWEFLGWQTNNGFPVNVLQSLLMGEDPITLYAVWRQGGYVPDQPLPYTYNGPALSLNYSPGGEWQANASVDKPDAITNATIGIMYLSIGVNGRGRSWQIPSEGHEGDAVEDAGTAGYGGQTFTISGSSSESINGYASPDPTWTGGQSWSGGNVHISNVVLKGYTTTQYSFG